MAVCNSRQKGLVIEAVAADSAASRAGIKPSERLLKINNKPVKDIIDYSYLAADDQLVLDIAGIAGDCRQLVLELQPGESAGLSFLPPVPRQCGNNCLFCFVHQLPKGLRKSLYIKDEDYRLSFLHGTYVTLSNLKPAELRRIIKLRLSPLYVSVHTTDPLLREKLLGRQGIPPILEQLRSLAAARIQMHCQIVLCPGLNDGIALEQTVADLAELYPSIQSLAVVPLGLTAHREKLPQLTAVNRQYAANLLDKWLGQMRKLNRRLGEPFLQLADEFFIKAGYPFPPLREYAELPQWENGVGMVAWFLKDAARVIKRAKSLPQLSATVLTGCSAAAVVQQFVDQLNDKTGAKISLLPVVNHLFGEMVTVTGLVSGKDIVHAFKDKKFDAPLLVPSVMLKDDENIFIDNMSVEQLKQELNTDVRIFEASPSGFYKALTAIKR
ncbi:MAG: DUF512 domain-containing protein [Trichlorobacter sp.]|nr:DUF512 domain-containing protein [Trichlorobacter sp.]